MAEGCPIDLLGGEVLLFNCIELPGSVKWAIVVLTLWVEAERIFLGMWLSFGDVLFESKGFWDVGEVFILSSLLSMFCELWLWLGIWKIWLIKCFTAFFLPFFLAEPFLWACSFLLLSNSSARSRIRSSAIMILWKCHDFQVINYCENMKASNC